MISLDTMENRKRLRYQKDVSSGTETMACVLSHQTSLLRGILEIECLPVRLQKKESVSTTTNGNKTNAVIKIFLAVSFFADALPLSYLNNNS